MATFIDGKVRSGPIDSAFNDYPMSGDPLASVEEEVVSPNEIERSPCGSLQQTSGIGAVPLTTSEPLIYHASKKRSWSKVLSYCDTTASIAEHEAPGSLLRSTAMDSVVPSPDHGAHLTTNVFTRETSCMGHSTPVSKCLAPYDKVATTPLKRVMINDSGDVISMDEVYTRIMVPNVAPNASLPECPTPYNTVASTPTDECFPIDLQVGQFTSCLHEFAIAIGADPPAPVQASIPQCATPYNTRTNTPTEEEFPLSVKSADIAFPVINFGGHDAKPIAPRKVRTIGRNIDNLPSYKKLYDNPDMSEALQHSLSKPDPSCPSDVKAATKYLSYLTAGSSDTSVRDVRTKSPRSEEPDAVDAPFLAAGSSGTTVRNGRTELPRSKPDTMDDGSHTVGGQTKYKYLALYFLFNLCLTLFNKTLMVTFPYPYLLTGLHAAFGCLGCSISLKRRHFRLSHLSTKNTLALYAFSILYTINIAVSNISLHMVTIPVHQVVRATTPAFTVAIYGLLYQKSYSAATYAALVPIIVGVGLTTYGDYSYTTMGLIMTLLGAFLASAKTIATNRLQTGGVRLSAMEILYRMSPLALLQSLVYAHFSGEGMAFYKDVVVPRKMTAWVVVVLALNGVMAFGLNVVSFAANKKVGALTMTVAGNVKQILTVVLGVALFDVVVGPVNAFGILLTLLGGALYARAEVRGRGTVVAAAALQGVVVEKL